MRSAEYAASQRGENIVTPEHLLLALLQANEPKSLLFRFVRALLDEPETIAAEVEAALSLGPGRRETRLQADPRFKDLIACAAAEAKKLRCKYVAPEHLLLAFWSDDGLAGNAVRCHLPTRDKAQSILNSLYGDLQWIRIPLTDAVDALPPLDFGELSGIWETWNQYTTAAKQTIYHAQSEAEQMHQNLVEPEHLLAGVLQNNDAAAARLLAELGIERNGLREGLSAILEEGTGFASDSDREFSPRSIQVMDESQRQMRLRGDHHIGTEHLMLGLLSDTGAAGRLLKGELERKQENSRGVVMALKQISRGPTVEGGFAPKPIIKGAQVNENHAWRWLCLFVFVVLLAYIIRLLRGGAF